MSGSSPELCASRSAGLGDAGCNIAPRPPRTNKNVSQFQKVSPFPGPLGHRPTLPFAPSLGEKTMCTRRTRHRFETPLKVRLPPGKSRTRTRFGFLAGEIALRS